MSKKLSVVFKKSWKHNKKQLKNTKNQQIRKQDIKFIISIKKRKIQVLINNASDINYMNSHLQKELKIMLEMNWLKKHNSRIDWKQKTVMMKNCECKIRQIQIKSWTKIRETILKQYWKYKKLFMKLSENQILSEHRSWDHEISLIERIMSEKLSIYQLSSEKLQEL